MRVDASPRRTSWIQRLRVPVGFLFGAFFLYWSMPAMPWLPAGLVVGLAGVAIRVWAAGAIQKHQRLSTAGPYAWTRNPLYFGSFLMGLGFTVAAASWLLVLLFVLLFLLIYFPVMQKEEDELTEAYGEAYLTYRDRTPLFLPSPPPQSKGSFSWGQVFANREHHAIVGYLLVAAFLIAKYLW